MALKVNWFIRVKHRNYNRMSASVWIRCLQLLSYLERRGVQSTINEPSPDTDVNIFVRWQDEEAYELARQQQKQGQTIVFDLVVNYFDEADVPSLGKLVTQKHIDQVRRMLSVADVVVCASAYIAQRARVFHRNVVYIPDSIDDEHFCHLKPIEAFYQPKIRAVWSGVAAKAAELAPILPLLRQRDIGLTIISNKRPRLKIPGRGWKQSFTYQFVPWHYETFPQHILDGEICLSHRPVDNPYNRGHSIFKIGVFMGQGVPAIASPVPAYQEVLQNNAGGCICCSIAEWESVLDRILHNRDVLAQWSIEARQAIKPYFTRIVVDRYVKLFLQPEKG